MNFRIFLITLFVFFIPSLSAQEFLVVDDMDNVNDWFTEASEESKVEISVNTGLRKQGTGSLLIFAQFEGGEVSWVQANKIFSGFQEYQFLRFYVNVPILSEELRFLVLLVERDESIYYIEFSENLREKSWEEVTLPLDGFSLLEEVENFDENDSLDLDKIQFLSLTLVHLGEESMRFTALFDYMVLLEDFNGNGVPDVDEVPQDTDVNSLLKSARELYNEGKFEDAKRLLDEARDRLKAIGEKRGIYEISTLLEKIETELRGEADAAFERGRRYFLEKDYESAISELREARDIYDELGIKDKSKEAQFLIARSKAELRREKIFGVLFLLGIFLLLVVLGFLILRRRSGVREKKKTKLEDSIVCNFCGRFYSKDLEVCPYCSKSQEISLRNLQREKIKLSDALEKVELRYMKGEIEEDEYRKLKKKWLLRLADAEEKILDYEVKKK
ncbi:MAG: hypothetical protein ACE5HW_04245 [Candidatus Methanofastidiosia archaeon]